ncbi:MAG: peptide chain release factor N(5)-glutamine methyltransferase [Ferruginibacter sp.]|nr:peptide chain release factor N(5)-glutamine methyltransferase [Ferruginibacter sp.]
MFTNMTIKELYKAFIKTLQQIYESNEATAIANITFEEYTSLKKNEIITKGETEVSEIIKEKLNTALERLLQNEPLQYILENAWFYNLQFTVNKNVLIPRPETEELVLEAINFIRQNNSKTMIDIGTGSGCISIAIKKNAPTVKVTAVDVSIDAINIAKQNALQNYTDIEFIEINFLEENNYEKLMQYDVIISNPPYIPNKEILDKNVVQFEPHLALFVPQNDPLIFYKKILSFADKHLTAKGKIFLEVHENFAKETAAIFTNKNYEVQVKLDMQGKERMLLICRCQIP